MSSRFSAIAVCGYSLDLIEFEQPFYGIQLALRFFNCCLTD
jgi:hypothetical protein